MATIDDKDFIDNIIRNDGFYNGNNAYSQDNSRCVKVVEYTNQWGKVTWGILFEEDNPFKYSSSLYVINPVTIWTYHKDNEEPNKT